jgi:hypothetical protein
VLAMAAAAAAGYHLLQLLKCFYLGRRVGGASPDRRSSRALAWTCLLLDKVRRNNSLRRSYSTTVVLRLLSKEGLHSRLSSEESSRFRLGENVFLVTITIKLLVNQSNQILGIMVKKTT